MADDIQPQDAEQNQQQIQNNSGTPTLSVVRLEEDPEHRRLVTKVDNLDEQVKSLLNSHHMIEQSSYRIERALFGGWSDSGERTEGFITTMNKKLTAVDEKAGQAIDLANETQTTFKNIKNGVWAIFVTVLTSLIPTALNIYTALHPLAR